MRDLILQWSDFIAQVDAFNVLRDFLELGNDSQSLLGINLWLENVTEYLKNNPTEESLNNARDYIWRLKYDLDEENGFNPELKDNERLHIQSNIMMEIIKMRLKYYQENGLEANGLPINSTPNLSWVD